MTKPITRVWLKEQLSRTETATEVTLPSDRMRALLQLAWNVLPEADRGEDSQYPCGTMN